MSERREHNQELATERVNDEIRQNETFKKVGRRPKKIDDKEVNSAVMHFGMGNNREGLTVVNTGAYSLKTGKDQATITCEPNKDDDRVA